jgi:hypothetical protein
MYILAFVVLGIGRPCESCVRQMKASIPRLFDSRLYEVKMVLKDFVEEEYPATSSVVSTVSLLPFERASWPGLKEGRVWVKQGRQYEIKRIVSFRIARLPFGLFLAKLRIEESIKEPGKHAPTPSRATASRIVLVGRMVQVKLGKDKIRGKRTWEVMVRDKGLQPGPRIAPAHPIRVPRDHK